MHIKNFAITAAARTALKKVLKGTRVPTINGFFAKPKQEEDMNDLHRNSFFVMKELFL